MLFRSQPVKSSIVRGTSLWLDRVGGFALCDASEFRCGSAMMSVDRSNNSQPSVDAEIFADIAPQAFRITTQGETTMLHPQQDLISINSKPINQATRIWHQDQIRVGRNVAIDVAKPNPLSNTLVLRLKSRHRWSNHVDAVLLVARCCLIGQQRSNHIVAMGLKNQWMLTPSESSWTLTQTQKIHPDPNSLRDSTWRSSHAAIARRIDREQPTATIEGLRLAIETEL